MVPMRFMYIIIIIRVRTTHKMCMCDGLQTVNCAESVESVWLGGIRVHVYLHRTSVRNADEMPTKHNNNNGNNHTVHSK